MTGGHPSVVRMEPVDAPALARPRVVGTAVLDPRLELWRLETSKAELTQGPISPGPSPERKHRQVHARALVLPSGCPGFSSAERNARICRPRAPSLVMSESTASGAM